MPSHSGSPSLKRAVALMAGSSFLVPAVGLVTAPLLARALGAEGRGDFTAALGPATLMLAVATLGLPEALTYELARRPRVTARALVYASLITLLLGALCTALTRQLLPFLSDGSDELASLMLLASVVTLPALLINVLRGAASGLQLWGTVALERVLVTVWRLVWFVGLFLSDHLTVLSAVLVIVTAPYASLPVYVGAWLRRSPETGHGRTADPEVSDAKEPVFRILMTFGARLWFGSVASMFLARVSALFMVPLSSSRELGLYSVAVTIADIPLLMAFAVQSAVFGVNSKTRDARQTAMTSRVTLLLGATGSIGLAAVLPLAIVPVFGPQFSDALLPSLLLLTNAVVSLPGLMAASALAAWGRPGLRSIGLACTLVANVAAFVLLVPPLGAVGAGYAGLISAGLMSGFMTTQAARVLGLPVRDFWRIRRADIQLVVTEAGRQLGRMRLRKYRSR